MARSASPEAARWTASAGDRRSGAGLDAVGEPGVQPAAPRGQHPGVGRVVDERMAEPPRARRRRAATAPRRPADRARAVGSARSRRPSSSASRNADADDGRDAEHVAGRLVEAVDAGAQDGPQRQRQPGRARFDELIRPSRSSSVPSSIEARTVSPMNNGLPCVRSWIRPRRRRRGRPGRRSSRAGPSRARARPSSWSRVDVRLVGPVTERGPGRIVAMTTSDASAAVATMSSRIPTLESVDPVDVVEDDDARSVDGRGGARCRRCRRRRGAAAVSAGSSGTTSAASASQPLNDARRGRWPRWRRRSAGSSPDRRSRPNSSCRAKLPESMPCSSATACAKSAREPVRLAAAVGDALGPGPGEAHRPRLGLDLGDEPRLAHPRLAGQRARPRRCPVRLARRSALRIPRGLGRPPDERPSDVERCRRGDRARCSPVRAYSRTTDDWPRSTTEPLVVDQRGDPGRRGRSPRRGGSRPGRASDWMRAAVVIASPVTARSPDRSSRDAGDDLAGGDPDPDLERLAAVVRLAQRGPDRERGQRRPGPGRRRGRSASRRPRTRRHR